MRRLGLLLMALVMLSQVGCKRNDEDPSIENFDKEAMLKNIATNVMIPAYEQTQAKLEILKEASLEFRTAPSESSLASLRSAHTQAYETWQLAAAFEFGPAADNGLRLAMNTFPVDSAQIESNIEAVLFVPGNAQNARAQGFPAIDYMLFESDDLSRISDSFRIVYAIKNIDYISEKLGVVLSTWKNGYSTEFASNTGSDVGSSMGLMVNELNYEFELTKNARVGIPFGKKSLGIPKPRQVEALYSGVSIDLIRSNLKGIQSAINGTSIESGAEGSGLDDYLDKIDARYGDQLLSEAIDDGFASIRERLDQITEPTLFDAIKNEPAKVNELHGALQNLVVLLKTDMPSRLGVQITYQDNDGD